MVGAGKDRGRDGRRQHAQARPGARRLHCVGATTLDEYRKYIERTPRWSAASRRSWWASPPWRRPSPSCAACRSATKCTTAWTSPTRPSSRRPSSRNRYITDRFLPDKAIDLIDEAAAKIKMEIDSKPEVMDKLDRRLIQLQIEREAVKKEKDEASKAPALIEEEITRLQKETPTWTGSGVRKGPGAGQPRSRRPSTSSARSKNAQRRGDFNKVAELQYGKLPELEKQLKRKPRRKKPAKDGAAARRLLRTHRWARKKSPRW